MVNNNTGGWCVLTILKNDGLRQWGLDDIPYMKWKINNVWNHQPEWNIPNISKYIMIFFSAGLKAYLDIFGIFWNKHPAIQPKRKLLPWPPAARKRFWRCQNSLVVWRSQLPGDTRKPSQHAGPLPKVNSQLGSATNITHLCITI